MGKMKINSLVHPGEYGRQPFASHMCRGADTLAAGGSPLASDIVAEIEVDPSGVSSRRAGSPRNGSRPWSWPRNSASRASACDRSR
jgi:hypothetical protein